MEFLQWCRFHCYLNAVTALFFHLALNSSCLSLTFALSFRVFFVCCLNANSSNIQFALKIGNLRNKQLSYSIYLFSSSLVFILLKSKNSPQIQRQSRTDFHYRRILIVIQKCTHPYWAGCFCVCCCCLSLDVLAFLPFYFLSWTNKPKKKTTASRMRGKKAGGKRVAMWFL